MKFWQNGETETAGNALELALVSGAPAAENGLNPPAKTCSFVPSKKIVARKTGKKRTRKTSQPDPMTVVNCDSDIVRRRLARMQTNYDLLDQMLAELESRVPDSQISSSGSANPGKPR